MQNISNTFTKTKKCRTICQWSGTKSGRGPRINRPSTSTIRFNWVCLCSCVRRCFQGGCLCLLFFQKANARDYAIGGWPRPAPIMPRFTMLCCALPSPRPWDILVLGSTVVFLLRSASWGCGKEDLWSSVESKYLPCSFPRMGSRKFTDMPCMKKVY